jgi:hypothetical protein
MDVSSKKADQSLQISSKPMDIQSTPQHNYGL